MRLYYEKRFFYFPKSLVGYNRYIEIVKKNFFFFLKFEAIIFLLRTVNDLALIITFLIMSAFSKHLKTCLQIVDMCLFVMKIKYFEDLH